jgi:tetratricopeptide (TPR) repeat protein
MRSLFCVALALFLAQPLFAADKWLSIHTKNFLLVGNASESDIRRVGRTLEEFRSAIAMVFPKMDQTSSTPTTILVFKNDESFKPYKPLYKGQPSNLIAFFQPGEDVNYIALPATVQSPNVVLHEYVHFLLRENIGGLPLWISEGLADSYSTFEIGKQNEFTLGKPPDQHIATFSTPQPFIPIKRLLQVQENSPEYNEESRQGMFYAESWAMVHYLVFGADGKRRNQFSDLLSMMGKGTTFEDAFGQAFQTDYGTLEDEVREYIRKRTSWPMIKVSSRDSLQVDVRAMNAVTMSDAESEFYLGDLLLHLNRLADAEPHLTAAAKTPSLTSAQASLAVLRVRQKRYDDAFALLKKAAEADSKNPTVTFYYAYGLERANAESAAALSNDAETYATMRTYAKKTIDLSPKFVEAYALLARADLNSGDNLDEAETTLKKAIAIAPGRDDLQMLLAQTYLRANRRDDARTLLSFIEKTATKPDVVKRATALLDQTEQAANFQEITQTIEKELKAEQPTAPAARTPAAPAPRRVQETVLEEITPVAPAVQGEKITGLLVNLDCSDGLTLRIRTDRTTTEFHSSEPQKIQFLSYTSTVSNDIRCGARNPGEPVTVTYKPNPGGGGEPLVVEFQEKK